MGMRINRQSLAAKTCCVALRSLADLGEARRSEVYIMKNVNELFENSRRSRRRDSRNSRVFPLFIGTKSAQDMRCIEGTRE